MTTAHAVAAWTACAVAAGVSAWTVSCVAWLPPEDLVTFFADDAFYYLVLGRNLAETGRLTFDGVNSATGFHPGWLAVSTLLSAAGLEGLALIRAAIVTALALHVVAACLIIVILRDAGAPGHAPWAGALWLANPVSLTLIVGGMEAALFAAALAAACMVFQRMLAAPAISIRRVRLTSCILAVLCLVRTDAALVAACAAVVTGLIMRRRGAEWRRIAAAAAILGLGPAIALAASSLWLLFQSGHLTQASGEIKMLWGSRASPLERLAFAYHVFGRLSFGQFGASMLGLPTKIAAAGAIAALAGVAWTARARWRQGETAAPGLAWWLLGSATVTTLAFALILVEYRSWYTALPAFAMFATLTIEAARRVALNWFAIACALGLATMVHQDVRMARTSTGQYPYARAIYLSVPIFDGIVPDGEPIASFDAGLRGYFARHRVINLDGLVNDAVRRHWRAGTLDAYLAEDRIRFVADEPGSLERARDFSRLPPMRAIACVPAAGTPFADRCLWQLMD